MPHFLHRRSLQTIVVLALVVLGMVYPVLRMAIKGFAPVGLFVPLALIIVWFIWRLRRPTGPIKTVLGLPLLVFSATFVLSCLLSPAPRELEIAMMFHWVAVGVLLFLSVDLLAQGCPPRYYAYAAIAMTSFALLVGLIQICIWVAGWLWLWQPGDQFLPVTYRKFLVGTQPNQAAMLFYIGLPFAISAWWQARRRWQQIGWAVWMLVATVLMFVTGSRGGWLATGAVASTILTPLLLRTIRERHWRRLVWTLSLGAGYSCVFLVLFLLNRQSLETQRGGSLFNPTGRTLFWSRAVQLFTEHALFGAGPTGYATYYNAVEPTSRLFRPGHAHNIYLMTLSESGIVGSVALLGVLAVVALIWRQSWHKAPALTSCSAESNEPRLLLLSCAAAQAGLAVHGMFDVPAPQISGIAVYICALALADGLRSDTLKPALPRMRWPHPLHVSIAALVLAVWGLSSYIFLQNRRADWLAAQAQQLFTVPQSELEQAFNRYTVALTSDPADDSAYRSWALALARLAENDRRLLPEALAAQKSLDETNPADFVAPVNRAALLLELGRTSEAEAELRGVIAADTSNWALPWLLLAHIQEQNNNPMARYSWQEMLRRQPDLVDSAVCQKSSLCANLPIPPSDTAILRVLQPRIDQRDPTVLSEMQNQAQQRLSVDLWAVGAMTAANIGDDHAAQRMLRAAVDQSEMIGSVPTRRLGVAQLRDALQRNDRATLARLVATWAVPADSTLVAQIGTLTATETDHQIAILALEAAQRVGDTRLMKQAQTYMGTVQQALAAVPVQTPEQR